MIQNAQVMHTPPLVKRVNWGYLYTPIQTGTFECGYTPAYWGYTKYECDYTPITWGYPNAPSIGDMLLNAFIWHFRSHAGNAQMGTSPVGSVSTFPLAESDVCPRFTPFTKHTHTHTHKEREIERDREREREREGERERERERERGREREGERARERERERERERTYLCVHKTNSYCCCAFPNSKAKRSMIKSKYSGSNALHSHRVTAAFALNMVAEFGTGLNLAKKRIEKKLI